MTLATLTARLAGLLALLFMTLPASAQPYVFEAESGTLGVAASAGEGEPGAEVRDDDAYGTSSGDGYVALQKGTITLDISSVPAGEYDLSVRYALPASFGAPKYDYVDVDGVRYGDAAECGETFTFGAAEAWTDLALSDTDAGKVTVDGSTGTLVIEACYGYTLFDAVTLTPAGGGGMDTFAFEFEDGTLGVAASAGEGESGAEVRSAQDGVTGDPSGGEFVALQKGVVTLDISSVPAGDYRVTLRYASPDAGNADGDRFEYFTVDGTRYGSGTECAGPEGPSLTFPQSAALADLAVVTDGSETVTVDGSTGELVVEACYGYIFLDAVTFEAVGATSVEGGGDGPDFSLAAMPNPFGTTSRVRFELDQPASVRLAVYDLLGREVARLADGPMGAGTHEATVSAAGLASGVYLVRLVADGAATTARITVQR